MLLTTLAHAATPVLLPAGEDVDDWSSAFQLADLRTGTGRPGVEILPAGGRWLLMVWSADSQLTVVTVTPATTAREREGIALLAVSLLAKMEAPDSVRVAGGTPVVPQPVPIPPAPPVTASTAPPTPATPPPSTVLATPATPPPSTVPATPPPSTPSNVPATPTTPTPSTVPATPAPPPPSTVPATPAPPAPSSVPATPTTPPPPSTVPATPPAATVALPPPPFALEVRAGAALRGGLDVAPVIGLAARLGGTWSVDLGVQGQFPAGVVDADATIERWSVGVGAGWTPDVRWGPAVGVGASAALLHLRAPEVDDQYAPTVAPWAELGLRGRVTGPVSLRLGVRAGVDLRTTVLAPTDQGELELSSVWVEPTLCLSTLLAGDPDRGSRTSPP